MNTFETTAVYDSEAHKVKSETLAMLSQRLKQVDEKLRQLEPMVIKLKDEKVLIHAMIKKWEEL